MGNIVVLYDRSMCQFTVSTPQKWISVAGCEGGEDSHLVRNVILPDCVEILNRLENPGSNRERLTNCLPYES